MSILSSNELLYTFCHRVYKFLTIPCNLEIICNQFSFAEVKIIFTFDIIHVNELNPVEICYNHFYLPKKYQKDKKYILRNKTMDKLCN